MVHRSIKKSVSFIHFDITDFYSPISENTLDSAIELAALYVKILNDDFKTLKYCPKSFIFHDNKPWIKNKITNSSMWPWKTMMDGEICELDGSPQCSQLTKRTYKENIGLYRNDGIIIIKEPNDSKLPRCSTKLRKRNIGTFQNDTPIYIHTSLNNPSSIIKQKTISIAVEY